MKITDIRIKTFRTYADRWDVGYAKPVPKAELMQTVLAIETDEGVTGHYLGGGSHGDAEGLNAVDQQMIRGRLLPLLRGQDPLDRSLHDGAGVNLVKHFAILVRMAYHRIAEVVATRQRRIASARCRPRNRRPAPIPG